MLCIIFHKFIENAFDAIVSHRQSHQQKITHNKDWILQSAKSTLDIKWLEMVRGEVPLHRGICHWWKAGRASSSSFYTSTPLRIRRWRWCVRAGEGRGMAEWTLQYWHKVRADTLPLQLVPGLSRSGWGSATSPMTVPSAHRIWAEPRIFLSFCRKAVHCLALNAEVRNINSWHPGVTF